MSPSTIISYWYKAKGDIVEIPITTFKSPSKNWPRHFEFIIFSLPFQQQCTKYCCHRTSLDTCVKVKQLKTSSNYNVNKQR